MVEDHSHPSPTTGSSNDRACTAHTHITTKGHLHLHPPQAAAMTEHTQHTHITTKGHSHHHPPQAEAMTEHTQHTHTHNDIRSLTPSLTTGGSNDGG